MRVKCQVTLTFAGGGHDRIDVLRDRSYVQ